MTTNPLEHWAKSIRIPFNSAPPVDLLSPGNAALMIRRAETTKGNATYRQSMDMQRTFYTLRRWASSQQQKPPFLVVCDIDSCFEVWTAFDGHYGSYGARKRIKWRELERHKDLFHTAFTNAQLLNPAKEKAQITREVIEAFSEIAQYLESRGHNPQEVALFLTRIALTLMLSQYGWLPNVPKSN